MERVPRVLLHDGCVVGSVHQGSQIFIWAGSGLQCVANAICSLLKSTQKSPHTWITSDIIDILQLGHVLYTQIGKAGQTITTKCCSTIHVCGWNELQGF